MKIISDFTRDVITPDKSAGGYEWWYFDATDESNYYKFVIIFYQGNPFSTRYIRALEDPVESARALPELFPAVSISIYEGDETLYYSFTEFDADDTRFNENRPELQIGKHCLEGWIHEDRLTYSIRLEEDLPSGYSLRAEISFESVINTRNLFEDSGQTNTGHLWNLVQPRAEVQGTLTIRGFNNSTQSVEFNGTGYHDHNAGEEPMRNEFTNWYWGRFHFKQSTLVYYVMNRKREQQYRAWLFDNDNPETIQELDRVSLHDRGRSVFGLNSSRRIELASEHVKVTIQQSCLLDNGPFYQRFISDAFLSIPADGTLQSCRGFTEFIHPDRIYRRLFWPLVHMRIRHDGGNAHWVQKSPRLYRWTW